MAAFGAEIEQLVVAGSQGDNKVEKGVAFPTCVSVNSTVGTFSPLAADTTALKENDLVKMSAPLSGGDFADLCSCFATLLQRLGRSH